MKVFFRRIHLYLAFGAGLVIMVTCLTGAILVFEKELQHQFYKDRYFSKGGGARLSLDELVANVKLREPGAKINSVKFYADPTYNTEVTLMKQVEGRKAGEESPKQRVKGEKKGPDGTRLIAFVDPYSGKVAEVYNHRKSFFYFTMDLHRWMLGGDTGKLIVGTCTLIFLFIIITGLILWWPKTKNILKQRLKIKWDSGWKRINHDFHIVLGFYSAIFLFIFAFTGLAWSFEWFNKGIYRVTGSSQEQPKPPVSIAKDSSSLLKFQEVLILIRATVPDVKFYNISAPKDSVSPYSVSVLPYTAAHETAADTYYVDGYRPVVLGSQKFGERNLGQKVRLTFRPVHVASIYGIPSKIIGFIVCLLGVFFPATGYIMWWNRTRKTRKA